jgi:ABC-type enterobactin transport system permease subunit
MKTALGFLGTIAVAVLIVLASYPCSYVLIDVAPTVTEEISRNGSVGVIQRGYEGECVQSCARLEDAMYDL